MLRGRGPETDKVESHKLRSSCLALFLFRSLPSVAGAAHWVRPHKNLIPRLLWVGLVVWQWPKGQTFYGG